MTTTELDAIATTLLARGYGLALETYPAEGDVPAIASAAVQETGGRVVWASEAPTMAQVLADLAEWVAA